MICYRPIFRAAVCLAFALALTGCGRRGPLEAPPGSTPVTPLSGVPEAAQEPRSELALPGEATAAAKPAAAPVKAPPRPFILDPLL
ncbi:LPS translocon maturation chaperone LptM [Methylocella tundrae]|uniref:Lipoprotein n=1 Tax=Methylocella tundrae TaxID=227605 RepID=A0A4U8YU20_METTU|nr:lipoprotein [Methylocella tundrae]WPP04964.1 lipoprotein [Methylocella tundrae]VFU07249.1 conserved exported protein of unknown function [Methylocella tundrae]